MPSPLGSSFARFIPVTGNSVIDSLLGGSAWGTGWGTTQLTYSFITPASQFAWSYSLTNEYQHKYVLTAAQKTAVTGALGAWSAVADIRFSLVTETRTSVGDMRFGGTHDMAEDSAAWAYFPARSPSAGDVWIGKHTKEARPVAGSYDYMTFMHEIGHALGLKHPFSGLPGNDAVLPPELDDVRYTLMSYNNAYSTASGYVEPSTPMLLDILVIQGLYGANTKWHAGNDTYSFKPDQVVFQTLWDAGGIDTLNASNQRTGVVLNLNEGEFSSIGAQFFDVARGTWINNGLAIAFGAKIENATGSAFADTLVGNALNNVLDGRGGQDIMGGGLGNDTYIVDDEGDVVIEESTLPGEIDTVIASVSYSLGDNLEVLTLTGRGNLNGTGNGLNNRITGNAGNNVLDGGAGADTLIGGLGNDTYIVDDLGDKLVEAANAGVDTVRASLSWVLGANLENLELTGADDLSGTGNALGNVLTGNAGNNILDGGLGADRMSGGQGDDIYYVDNLRDIVVEAAGEGRDLVRASVSHVLAANVEEGELLGKANLNLTGNAGNNKLTGNAGNNVLKGQGGQDTLIGGLGNDTYYVDSADDLIIEEGLSAKEIDTVIAAVDWRLGANLENLMLVGTAGFSGTGNALNNRITGNAGDNLLDGGEGADILIGGMGNDTYLVDNAGDQIIEGAGKGSGIDTVRASLNWVLGSNLENLWLTGSANLKGTGNSLANQIVGNSGDNLLFGGAGNDRLAGNEGNDLLDGGLGSDQMAGGVGDDIYYVDNLGDVVIEQSAEGHDLVRASISYVLGKDVEDGELLGRANLTLTGNEDNNVLTGNSGANVLRGGGGADTLIGGLGNDTYYVDSTDDVIREEGQSRAEIDSVFSSVDWSLGANLENLTLTGQANLNGTGNALNNRITGNAGDNELDGGAGIDTLVGGLGNDTYVVDNLRDVIIETSKLASEIDTVRSSVNWALGANLENLELTGQENLKGTGNLLDNRLTGNAGDNLLDGGAGNDVLDGGAGDDVLVGGLGTDTLTGGAGADRFVFNLLKELGAGDKRDVITDFSHEQGDRIDLSKLDANLLVRGLNAFQFIEDKAFTGAGQLRFADEILSGNIDGNLNADFEIHLVGVTHFSTADLVA